MVGVLGWLACWAAVRSGGGYVNAMSGTSGDQLRHSFGLAKYERLARIKAGYRPGNPFHDNAYIQPA